MDKKIKINLLSLLIGAGLSSFLGAEILNLQQGWNLVGSSNELNLSRDFNNSNIKIVWRYINGRWQYFSPNEDVKNLISSDYSYFTQTKPNEGFWVFAQKPITIITTEDSVINKLLENKTYIGKIWGYNWFKIYGGDVEVHNDKGDVVITAYGDENNTKAGAVTSLYKVSKLKATINLSSDENNSFFVMSGVAKLYDNKVFRINLNFYKNKISASWDKIYSDGSVDEHSFFVKNFDEDLTNLKTSGSDIKTIIAENNGILNLEVINLATKESIFDTNLSLNDINLTGFKGFDFVMFLSQIGDKNAKEATNIINTFSASYGDIDLNEFNQLLSQKGFSVLDYNLSNKTIVGDDFTGEKSNIITFNDSTIKYYVYNKSNLALSQNYEVNYSVINGIYKTNNDFFAPIKNNLDEINVMVYDSDSGLWNEKFLILNNFKNEVITSSNIKNFFNTSFISVNINGSWEKDNNTTFSFEQNKFSISNGGNIIKTGTYSVNNNVIEIDMDDRILYMLPVEQNGNNVKFYYILTDKEGYLKGGGIYTLIKS